jgi:catechol 2,3-dioxygenase-like lactoylglutathione lyase family enzyme
VKVGSRRRLPSFYVGHTILAQREEAGVAVLGIDNVLFAVGDLAEARRFYGDVLGLDEKFAFPDAGLVGYRLGPEEPGLLLRADATLGEGPPLDTPRLWLEVPDARAFAGRLDTAGVQPLAPARQIRTGWVVEVADPWGNVVGLTDYVDAPERARPGN